MTDIKTDHLAVICTAFIGARKIAQGTLLDVALALNPLAGGATEPVLVFDDATGAVIDIDLRGSTTEMVSRMARADGAIATAADKRRGRPKLGVVAREITLLPRHWDWLATQPGGASQVLRRLVDQARRADAGQTARGIAHERAYRFMIALAGDYPGFEDAARALFADNMEKMAAALAAWPSDVGEHALKLAQDRHGDGD